MMNTASPQLDYQGAPNSVKRRLEHSQRETPVRGVVQDKPLPKTARSASHQPGSVNTPHRADSINTHSSYSQSLYTGKLPAVKVSGWIDPRVKKEMERIAEVGGLTLSKVVAKACDEFVHRSILEQHEALLFPMIRQVIREELRSFGDRIVHFLMYIAVAIEAIRILITNVLDRILIWTGKPDEYATLVQRADIRARQKVNDKIPFLKTLVQTWNTNPTDQEVKKGEAG